MLDKRLLCIASMLPSCRGIADVGVDHGLLICHLIGTGRAHWGIATDIHEEPLKKARMEICRRGLEKKICCLMTDGLNGISSTHLDGIIIAGMGGETIIHIINNWPYSKSSNITWLLQPMTKSHRLRAWLWKNGFNLCEENCCQSSGHVYSIIKATWTGFVYHPSLAELYFGKIDPIASSQNRSYCQNLLKRTAQIAQNTATAHSKDTSVTAYQLWKTLKNFLDEKGET